MDKGSEIRRIGSGKVLLLLLLLDEEVVRDKGK